MRKAFGALVVAAAVAVWAGCADPEELFKSGRLLEKCDQAWPVCTTTAGCILTNAGYLEGRLPGTRRFVVRTEGPAKVTVALYLRTEQATGEETRIEFNDARCGAKAVETVGGKELFKEFDSLGEFRRERELYQGGDHLIELSSDATADYLLKVIVDER